MSFLRRLSIPLVLAFFALLLMWIGWTQLKSGYFTYTSETGTVQTFSPTENAGVFWGFSAGLCVAGILLLVAAVYLFLRLRPSHPRGQLVKGMPMGLRFLTFICFGFALFLPLSLLPFGGSINGQEVSFTEFWRRGGGPTFFIIGILFPITGYGFLRARNWSRYLFAGFNVALAVFSVFGSLPVFSSLPDAVIELVLVAAITYYLFCWPAVRNYFGVPNTNST
jgi:hypothetical protein